MYLRFKNKKTKMSEKLSSYNPEIDPGKIGALVLKNPDDELADTLIEHVEQGAVPLISSINELDQFNGRRVMDAIDKNPDRIIGDSMVAQIEANKIKR